MAVGSGRGSWCGVHGPWTGWPATFRYSTSCGNAHTVGLLPVFGAFSISWYMRGLPSLWPSDSTGTDPLVSSRVHIGSEVGGPNTPHCDPRHACGQLSVKRCLSRGDAVGGGPATFPGPRKVAGSPPPGASSRG